MIKKIQNSLGISCIIGLGGVLVFILMTITLMNISRERRILTQRAEEMSHRLGNLILTAMHYPMLTGDQEVIQVQFDGYKKMKGIEIIHLLDHEGIIRRSTDPDLVGKRSLSPYASQAMQGKYVYGIEVRERSEDMVFTKATPILNEKNCYPCHGKKRRILGALKISLDWQSTIKAINIAKNQNIVLSISGLIIMGILTAIFLLRIVILPLQRLETGMRKVSQADFSQRIISKSKDEIGRLTQIFNKMAQDLMTLMQKERKKTEELNRSLSLLSATLESTADGILAVDRQGKIVSFNHRFVQMWNIPAEILESRDDEQALRFVLEQVKSPADFLNKVKSLYGQPQLSSLDVIEFKDGRVFERYSQPQRLSDEIIGRVWSFHDVTERVAAGRKWQEQNIFLNNIIESLTHPFYVIDTNDYTVKMANTAARQKEVAENFFCYKLTHKSDRPCTGPEHICPLEIVKKEKKPIVIEHIHYRQDGNEQYVEIHGYPILDSGGDVVQMIEYCIDITERKKAEKGLQESEARFRKIAETSEAWIWQVNSEGLYTYASPIVEKILGYTPEEIIGKKHFYDFFDPQERDVLKKEAFAAFDQKKFFRKFINKNLHKNGEVVFLETNGRPILNEQGELLGYLGVDTDITDLIKFQKNLERAYVELNEAQQQLIQSAKMSAMGQLAAGISHELNQPLTGIKGFAQAALIDLKETDWDIKQDLERIIEQTERMDGIIKNVKIFSRRSEFRMVELDIHTPLENALKLLTEQLKVRNIRLKKDLAKNLPRLKGDDNQLQQVFINLITNARDAIDSLNRPEGSQIMVKTALSADRQSIEIMLEDTGCGISREDQEHIFNPFFTSKGPDKGMGLGLAIVYRIIENHKGRIEFESEKGKGTRFKITLPIASPLDA